MIKDQGTKLKILINHIVFEEMVDTGTGITIIALKSWHPN